MELHNARLESRILEFGKQVFAEVERYKPGRLEIEYLTEKLMEFGMRDEALKVSLFRFVDVLPGLTSSASIIEHVQEYFEPVRDRIPGFLQPGFKISPKSLASAVVAKAIRKQVTYVAERFIVGETPESAMKELRKIRKNKFAFTVDLLGEATVSETEAAVYTKRYLDLLTVLAQTLPNWNESAPIIPGHRGEKTALNISVKPSALYSQFRPVNTEANIRTLVERLAVIFSKVKEVGGFVYVDMEDCSMTTTTIEAFKQLLSSAEFKDFPNAGIVLQAYLRRTERDVESLLDWVKQRDVPIAVRLVKGAYWDTETILAKQHGWPIPVWQKKSCSDANYEKLTLRLLENHQLLYPAFGSHNVRSLAHACIAAEEMKIPSTAFELQTLYGMADPIKKVFVHRGYLIREYAPVGELLPGMGYLVRRLLENTSNEGFLRASFHDQKTAESLLAKPEFVPADSGIEHLGSDVRRGFYNVALRDQTEPESRQNAQAALSKLRTSLIHAPRRVVPVLSGREQTVAKTLESVSPDVKSQVLGQIGLADVPMADRAVLELSAFFPEWRKTPVTQRAEILFKAAKIMESRRDDLTALMRLEAGKPLTEADADVAEAIDFLNYYALEALRLDKTLALGSLPGEVNTYFYEPRGVALIISPWNFPLAIPCGMFAAALVTGNCAILKPAEQTSLIAAELFDILLAAGLPPQAAAFLPGIGEEVGAHLATHKGISTICFTGSKDVGLSLIEHGAEKASIGKHVRRVIAEMGGKNAIIVDEDADLDEAVKGVLYSAFGFEGQKCSACSLAIVLEGAYEKFLHRLADAVSSLTIGPAADPESFTGPVIDREAYERITAVIAEARSSCRLVAEAPKPANPDLGFYVPPVVFADVPEGHALRSREIFGPVLAVLRARDFGSALELAQASEYALTGGVFSRSPKNIQRAVREFRVGNLYLNRGCTGALVYRQPFGGACMSGVGSKAGGPDYLLQFLIPRSVSENTIRRGFAPVT